MLHPLIHITEQGNAIDGEQRANGDLESLVISKGDPVDGAQVAPQRLDIARSTSPTRIASNS